MTEDEFDEAIERERGSLVEYAERKVGTLDAEECVQAALEEIVGYVERVPLKRVSAFFRRIVKSRCIDVLRHRDIEERLGYLHMEGMDIDAEDPSQNPEAWSAAREAIRHFHAKLGVEATNVLLGGGSMREAARAAGVDRREMPILWDRAVKSARYLGLI